MSNKMLYIRDADEQIWQEADQLAKESKIEGLSQIATRAIRQEVEKAKEIAELKNGIKRIDLEIEDDKGTRKIAFNGKWLITDYRPNVERPLPYLTSVALTQNESYLVFWESQDEHADFYRVYEYYDDLISDEDIPEELKSMVASEVGEKYVEFLDI